MLYKLTYGSCAVHKSYILFQFYISGVCNIVLLHARRIYNATIQQGRLHHLYGLCENPHAYTQNKPVEPGLFCVYVEYPGGGAGVCPCIRQHPADRSLNCRQIVCSARQVNHPDGRQNCRVAGGRSNRRVRLLCGTTDDECIVIHTNSYI